MDHEPAARYGPHLGLRQQTTNELIFSTALARPEPSDDRLHGFGQRKPACPIAELGDPTLARRGRCGDGEIVGEHDQSRPLLVVRPLATA